MQASDFDFTLPPELIAQQPRPRGKSRLLVLSRQTQAMTHSRIQALPALLKAGDCLVVNDTKVLPARLCAVKVETGARIEVLLHRELETGLWEALARPVRRLQTGTRLKVGATEFEVTGCDDHGRVRVRFPSPAAAVAVMRRYGEPPLPPYIKRSQDTDWRKDRARYQTVFASRDGSVAAPTAGLHFSPSILYALKAAGIAVAKVTLHVGWGTFSPLPAGDLSSHVLHHESFEISDEAADTIANCRQKGGRVVACGTTVARTLESAARPDGQVEATTGETSLFIRPGYTWKAVDALLTNFHLPQSSLLMLVCALAGREPVLQAYAEAVRGKYYFYSYGDAMILL